MLGLVTNLWITQFNKIVDSVWLKSNRQLKDPSRFEFLDGYRGSLALIVVIIHSIVADNCDIIKIMAGYSQTYSIAGFFMLSAFLLTYRLLKDLTKATTLRLFIVCLLKYFIRRFFRIYGFYILFYAISKYICPWPQFINLEKPVSFYQVVTLGYPGVNHMWTIPSEIKYYSVVPLFCLTALMLKSFACLLLFVAILWTIWDQNFNFFNLTSEQTKFSSPESSELKTHFAVFFIGSQSALAYFLIETNETIQRCIKTKWIQILFNYLAIIIGILGIRINAYVLFDRFNDKSKAAIFWSITLLLTIISQPNTISRYFTSSWFLKSLGKYSFSCYLLHAGVINMLIKIFKWKTYQIEFTIISITIVYFVSLVSFYMIEDLLIELANQLCNRLDDSFQFKSQIDQRDANDKELLISETVKNFI